MCSENAIRDSSPDEDGERVPLPALAFAKVVITFLRSFKNCFASIDTRKLFRNGFEGFVNESASAELNKVSHAG